MGKDFHAEAGPSMSTRRKYKYITKPPKGYSAFNRPRGRRPRRSRQRQLFGDSSSPSDPGSLLIADAKDQAQRGNCHHALRLLTQAAGCGSGVSEHELLKARSFIAVKCLRK